MAYTPKTKEFTSKAGNKYTFQTVMNSKTAEIIDEGTGPQGKVLNHKMIPLMLEHVVVTPAGLTMDEFDTWTELEEVSNEAFRFLRAGQ
ncbi:hypothetical protein AAGS61_05945 [Lysinibacillus sp. KU-BSD001]|uniref:hypothetical protein n=1 Tax=Lysinibacillus sp. KU-BSD001 TaxID=3141328 RepID=UPI0036F0B929